MVDLSPSTRGASYRDRQALDRRIHELLGDTAYRVQFFADGIGEVHSSSNRLPDLSADRTTYAPPAAAAVLLFSDCQFSIPHHSPPTYVVIDPGLEDPADAAVTDLEIRGTNVAASARNSGGPRTLLATGTVQSRPTTLPVGSIVISQPLAKGASRVSAEVSPGDAWPENDTLSTIVPPPQVFERWWVGRSNPGAGWRVMLPADLPTDPAAYLSPAIIVLENVSTSDLSELQQQRMNQYVRDLGGGLIILGGDRAFAAGGYEGTVLDSLSPLASYPPRPTSHWVLLADGSGSMSTPVAGATRWKFVTDALVQTLPHLPPQDLVSVGSFAESLQWWVEGKPVHDAISIPLPPANAQPHGPTNLQPALEAIARSVDGTMPIRLLVLSDFDTEITDPAALANLLKSKNVHLHLLAIGEGSALPALRQVATETAGSVMTELDPNRWANSATEVARHAGSKLLERDPIDITFDDALAAVHARTTSTWNRVWLKDSAGRIAGATRGSQIPMAAHWNLGEGGVLGVAFNPTPALVERLSSGVSRPPHDSRFHVSWETGPTLKVVVDAIDNGKYLNGLALFVELSDSASSSGKREAIPQSAPGEYQTTLAAPRSPCIATVRAGAKVIARRAIAGRYAPEFEAIGNDHVAMRELASRSGGAVISPNQTGALNIHWPLRPVPLASPLAIIGAIFIACGLIWQRIR
jgi:hypothetical protein